MAELTIIFIVVASVGWVVWTVRMLTEALKDAGLDEAWGFTDSHYAERRRFEERKRVVDKARTAAANYATKDHFLNKEPLEGSTP